MADGQKLFDAAAARVRGDGGARDLPGAREAVPPGAGAGRADAAGDLHQFLAAGVGGPRDWAAALRLLAGWRGPISAAAASSTDRGHGARTSRRSDRLAFGERLCKGPEVIRFPASSRKRNAPIWPRGGAMLEPAVVIDRLGPPDQGPPGICDSIGFTWRLRIRRSTPSSPPRRRQRHTASGRGAAAGAALPPWRRVQHTISTRSRLATSA